MILKFLAFLYRGCTVALPLVIRAKRLSGGLLLFFLTDREFDSPEFYL